MKPTENKRKYHSKRTIPELSHDRVVFLNGAYLAFIAAAVISLISGDGHIKTENWAICLWTLSLPFLVAHIMLDFIVRERQRRKDSGTRGAMSLIGHLLSHGGTAALLANYSWLAASIYFVLFPALLLLISEVTGLGYKIGFEDL